MAYIYGGGWWPWEKKVNATPTVAATPIPTPNATPNGNENTARMITFTFQGEVYEDQEIYLLDIDNINRYLEAFRSKIIARIPITNTPLSAKKRYTSFIKEPQNAIVAFSYWHRKTDQVEHVYFTEEELTKVDVFDSLEKDWSNKALRENQFASPSPPREFSNYHVQYEINDYEFMGGRQHSNRMKRKTIKKRKQNRKNTQSKKRNNKK
jgi:hypothetical protein